MYPVGELLLLVAVAESVGNGCPGHDVGSDRSAVVGLAVVVPEPVAFVPVEAFAEIGMPGFAAESCRLDAQSEVVARFLGQQASFPVQQALPDIAGVYLFIDLDHGKDPRCREQFVERFADLDVRVQVDAAFCVEGVVADIVGRKGVFFEPESSPDPRNRTDVEPVLIPDYDFVIGQLPLPGFDAMLYFRRKIPPPSQQQWIFFGIIRK